MLDGGVSLRYARAMFDVAAAAKAVDQFEGELGVALELMTGDAEVAHFWLSKKVQVADKKRVVESALGERGLSRPVVNFLKVVVDKGREASLAGMVRQYSVLADDYRHVQDAEVIAPMALTEETLARVTSGLEAKTGRKVRVKLTIHPDLIGGIVVRMGDQVLDGSIAARLTGLKRAMVSNS